jgi:hypothetical protein
MTRRRFEEPTGIYYFAVRQLDPQTYKVFVQRAVRTHVVLNITASLARCCSRNQQLYIACRVFGWLNSLNLALGFAHEPMRSFQFVVMLGWLGADPPRPSARLYSRHLWLSQFLSQHTQHKTSSTTS